MLHVPPHRFTLTWFGSIWKKVALGNSSPTIWSLGLHPHSSKLACAASSILAEQLSKTPYVSTELLPCASNGVVWYMMRNRFARKWSTSGNLKSIINILLFVLQRLLHNKWNNVIYNKLIYLLIIVYGLLLSLTINDFEWYTLYHEARVTNEIRIVERILQFHAVALKFDKRYFLFL